MWSWLVTEMTERPDPPEEIAQYILDGLDRQNAETL